MPLRAGIGRIQFAYIILPSLTSTFTINSTTVTYDITQVGPTATPTPPGGGGNGSGNGGGIPTPTSLPTNLTPVPCDTPTGAPGGKTLQFNCLKFVTPTPAPAP